MRALPAMSRRDRETDAHIPAVRLPEESRPREVNRRASLRIQLPTSAGRRRRRPPRVEMLPYDCVCDCLVTVNDST